MERRRRLHAFCADCRTTAARRISLFLSIAQGRSYQFTCCLVFFFYLAVPLEIEMF
jgi:hypothetical protein